MCHLHTACVPMGSSWPWVFPSWAPPESIWVAPEAAKELLTQDGNWDFLVGSSGFSCHGGPADVPSHPVLQAHIEAVHADWKEYLNLLICEESHLKFMEDFHKVPHPWGQRLAGAQRADAGLWEILEYKNSCYSGN